LVFPPRGGIFLGKGVQGVFIYFYAIALHFQVLFPVSLMK
jgi:hypothetical protein